jgi:hypothetical protein
MLNILASTTFPFPPHHNFDREAGQTISRHLTFFTIPYTPLSASITDAKLALSQDGGDPS